VLNPYLIPVFIHDDDELRALAKTMMEVCEQDPQSVPHGRPSTSEEEAIERASLSDITTSGHLRFIQFSPGSMPINLALTLDTYNSEPLWNLSISIATGKTPIRVRDDVARRIVSVFLGEGYTEVPALGYWDTVRQFVKLKEM